jgi:hypothetical protein
MASSQIMTYSAPEDPARAARDWIEATIMVVSPPSEAFVPKANRRGPGGGRGGEERTAAPFPSVPGTTGIRNGAPVAAAAAASAAAAADQTAEAEQTAEAMRKLGLLASSDASASDADIAARQARVDAAAGRVAALKDAVSALRPATRETFAVAPEVAKPPMPDPEDVADVVPAPVAKAAPAIDAGGDEPDPFAAAAAKVAAEAAAALEAARASEAAAASALASAAAAAETERRSPAEQPVLSTTASSASAVSAAAAAREGAPALSVSGRPKRAVHVPLPATISNVAPAMRCVLYTGPHTTASAW